ncbi:MAG: glycosyltransferase family 39 protein [Bacteroidales bacterium]|jgi:4-amino-4-deoxy-L-arabinose transferase-like glycosyltransferase|nr:glycosyltransferase family 39 protein [Bacteroidales bacterium]
MAHLKKNWKYVLFFLLISAPIFLHLSSFSIRLWDESRLATNACEMLYSGNYITTTFNGAPDMWNTKPPLMIWLQVLSMKLFGINEWAVRFPSAMAALLTSLLLLLFSIRYLKNFWFGFIWVLVLVTSSGYIEIHAARTGDYDALLTLFLTLAGFSFYFFLDNSKTKYLYLFFISMTFAVLTKSAAALLILPGFFIYTIIMKKILFLLKNKHLYIGFMIFLVCTSSYYILREMENPGYINAMLNNEFGKRFITTIEEHRHSFWFYFEYLFSYKYIIWVFFIPWGIFVGIKNKDLKINNLTLFTSITILTYFLVISSAQTKLTWYAVPMYPFLAFLVGLFIYHIFNLILKKFSRKAYHCFFLIVIFLGPYTIILSKIVRQKQPVWQKEENGVCYYLKDIKDNETQNDNFTILYEGVFTHGKFYLNPLLAEGKNIKLKDCNKNFDTGEIVLFSQSEVKTFLEERYELKILEEFHITGLYEIVGKK